MKGATRQMVRWNAIRRILRTRAVATQEDLGDLLHRAGFKVNQATLSRDLGQLGATRVPRPGGGVVYELVGAPAGEDELRELGQMVFGMEDNGTLVVLQTQPGAASAVARAIDLARLPEALGTLAGDDTIFIAPSQDATAAKLRKRLMQLFSKGD